MEVGRFLMATEDDAITADVDESNPDRIGRYVTTRPNAGDFIIEQRGTSGYCSSKAHGEYFRVVADIVAERVSVGNVLSETRYGEAISWGGNV